VTTCDDGSATIATKFDPTISQTFGSPTRVHDRGMIVGGLRLCSGEISAARSWSRSPNIQIEWIVFPNAAVKVG
jgi:hypothetical protein